MEVCSRRRGGDSERQKEEFEYAVSSPPPAPPSGPGRPRLGSICHVAEDGPFF